MQDSEIVELYFERNERAVTESDLKYGKRLRQASFNILKDGYEAEECVNDTYFKAWNTIPPTRPSSLMAFLLRIARNLSLDRWRMRSALKRDGVTLPLEEISESENHMHRRIRQLSNMKSERLSIGASSHTAQYLLPVICKEFYRRYPDIQVRVDMGNSKNITSLHDELSQNSIDLLISYSFDPQENRATLLIEERLIISMHKDLAGASDLQKYSVTREELISRTYSPEKEIEDFSIFKGIRFLRFRKGSLSYQHMAKIIGDYAAASYTIENISNTGLHYNMMAAGLGALLVSDTIVATSAINSENILYFVLKCPESYRKVYILSKLEGSEKSAAKKFVETASEVCSSHNVLKLLF